ncbi:class I SAM-dependent methyltransferase [Stackebrandtia nassauensis]|uniref:Methyltransferase type 11 n=1 Tax=Stackebrandtia nassauensis (strain DSM 44728 / CIP 108903 / NRRL B-16338 / NBRC 102104 / LLR-40K-21) TaxID=446470 RepID=D3PX78_STANL|nr:class I SAM-dependent methyltransferase [Stackebrandtia nassauensis]ADD41341.1 Methyltransferase type 11 [Stackebrandtia nassauensis DSM 44728]
MNSFDERMRHNYAGRAEIFERTFGKLCAYPVPTVLDAVGVAAGTRLLDVGCGTGSVAAAARDRGAAVTAVDPEQSMVEIASRRVPEATVLAGELPRLPFEDDAFDAVVANFVLNHVGDPLAALGELRRVLRPHGRLGLTIWPQPPTPLHGLWPRVFEAAGVDANANVARLAADKDFERTEAGLAGLLADAKFVEVETRTVPWKHRVDPELWWSGPAAGLASFGQVLAAQTPETVARIKREYDRLSAEFRVATGELALPTAALLAVAVAP